MGALADESHGATPWRKRGAAGGSSAAHLPRPPPPPEQAYSRPAPRAEVRAPERPGAASALLLHSNAASPPARGEICCSVANHSSDFQLPIEILAKFLSRSARFYNWRLK